MTHGAQRHELGRIYQRMDDTPLEGDLTAEQIDRLYQRALRIIQRRKPFQLQLYKGDGAQTFPCTLDAFKAWR